MKLFKVVNKPRTPFYVIHDKEFGLLQIYYDTCFEYWMFFYSGNKAAESKTEPHYWDDEKIPTSDLELLVLFGLTLEDVPGVLKYMDLVRSRETRITARVETALWWARHQK